MNKFKCTKCIYLFWLNVVSDSNGFWFVLCFEKSEEDVFFLLVFEQKKRKLDNNEKKMMKKKRQTTKKAMKWQKGEKKTTFACNNIINGIKMWTVAKQRWANFIPALKLMKLMWIWYKCIKIKSSEKKKHEENRNKQKKTKATQKWNQQTMDAMADYGIQWKFTNKQIHKINKRWMLNFKKDSVSMSNVDIALRELKR